MRRPCEFSTALFDQDIELTPDKMEPNRFTSFISKNWSVGNNVTYNATDKTIINCISRECPERRILDGDVSQCGHESKSSATVMDDSGKYIAFMFVLACIVGQSVPTAAISVDPFRQQSDGGRACRRHSGNVKRRQVLRNPADHSFPRRQGSLCHDRNLWELEEWGCFATAFNLAGPGPPTRGRVCLRNG